MLIAESQIKSRQVESARRAAFVAWFQYADEYANLLSDAGFDRRGAYTCGACAYYRPGSCELVAGEISGAHGSCRYWSKRLPVPQAFLGGEKIPQRVASYAETEAKGFGCARCEYASEAETKENGRSLFCGRGGFHVAPNGCCALNDADEVWNA